MVRGSLNTPLTRTDKRVAILYFISATIAAFFGVGMAVYHYPGGFDWMYTVMSHLASTTRNPDGGRWLAGGMFVAAFLLWPATYYLASSDSAEPEGERTSPAVTALRLGLICGALLGVEGLLDLRYSHYAHKAHETLALFAFLGFYGGVLGLYYQRLRAGAACVLPTLLVVLPLCAVGLSQLFLYFDQRDLGWVGVSWREMGVPFWLSFAFWQWSAGMCLLMGIGHLIASAGRSEPGSATEATVEG